MKKAFVICLGALVFGYTASSAAHAQARILESGSTLLYPLMSVWAKTYAQAHPDVTVETSATGSGIGIAAAISGDANLGASDAYLTDKQMAQPRMLNIPLAVSAQQVNYNVPELKGAELRLSGPVLAGMYDGKIVSWDDPKIAALNPGKKLPHNTIVPIHRTDGSGDTFLFTQYLSFSTPEWDKGPHYSTKIAWPAVSGALEAKGNAGMVQLCKDVPYSVAYVGISFLEQAKSDGLQVAAIENRDGAFVVPDAATIQATAAAASARTPNDGRVSLVFTAGHKAYPIVNFEYAVVRQQQSAPGMAAALRSFLGWIADPNGGSTAVLLDPVHFGRLPDGVLKISRAQIASIQGP